MSATASRWQQVKEIAAAALELAPAEREPFLAGAAAGDPELAAELASLLAYSQRSENFLERPAFVAAAPEAGLVGSRLGPYRVVEEIAIGGMGEVLRAVRADQQFEQEVAIKLLRRDGPGLAARERFLRERQILASLEHPHIARLIDGGETPSGRPYLVMEYVHGLPLDRYCRETGASLHTRIALLITVCEAVHYAHARLWVHRDLKPANILVTGEGVPKLLDFGIAKLLDATPADGSTIELGRMATPQYASPEHLRGEVLSTASDVYSLGVILYRLLCGELPAPNDRAALARALDAAAEPPLALPSERAAANGDRRLAKELAGDLDLIVMRALRAEPAARYDSADRLAEDLRRYLAGLPVAARRGDWRYRARKFVARHRVSVAAGALAAAVAVLGIAGVLWQAQRAEVARAVAEGRFAQLHALAHAVIFDYHDAILPLAGSLQVRARLVTDALSYLDSLSRDAADDIALSRDLASAYEKVAAAQSDLVADAGAERDQAAASFAKARRLRESLAFGANATSEDRHALARLLLRWGEFEIQGGELRGAVSDFERGLGLLPAGDPDRADALRLRASLDAAIGMAYGCGSVQGLGDLAYGERRHDGALATLDRLRQRAPQDEAIAEQLAELYFQSASMRVCGGELAEAGRRFEAALALHETLLAAHPERALHGARAAMVRVELGTVAELAGDIPAALRRMEEAREQYAPLQLASPRDALAASELGLIELKRAGVLAKAGQLNAAGDAADAAIALLAPLVRELPRRVETRLWLGAAYSKRGVVHAERREWPAAIRRFERCLAILEDLPGAPSDPKLRANAAIVRIRLARAELGAGRPGEAIRVLAAALQASAALHRQDPDDAGAAVSYAEAAQLLGDAHRARARKASAARPENWRAAREAYARSLSAWREMEARGTLPGAYRNRPAETARALADCEAWLGAQA